MGESLKSLKVSVFRMENNVKEAVDIAGAGIDPEALNKALEQQKKEYLEKIDDIFQNLRNKQNRLELMEKRIRNLQNEQKQMRRELEKKISMSKTKQKTNGKSPPGANRSRTITVKPPAGEIIEQELE
jgi:TolA-binding protein